jgi:hypothetical protein
LASCFLGLLHCSTELPNRVSIFAEHRRHQAVESTECLDFTLLVQLSEIFDVSRFNKPILVVLRCLPIGRACLLKPDASEFREGRGNQ